MKITVHDIIANPTAQQLNFDDGAGWDVTSAAIRNDATPKQVASHIRKWADYVEGSDEEKGWVCFQKYIKAYTKDKAHE